MSKINTLPTFTSAPNSSQMNDAFTKITEAFDNTVSRDGSSPNTMSADLDLNSNDILNVNTLESENVNVNGTLTVNGSPIGASIPVFSSTEDGLVPASGGGTDNFLRADGTWAEPAGGGGGGSSAWSDLTDVPAPVTALSGVNTGDETASSILTKLLTVDGAGSGLDADLLDGQSSAAFATAAQGTLAASASQPGHTHAAADVAAPGSTTQIVYNNAGVLTGATGALIEANQLRLPSVTLSAAAADGVVLGGQKIAEQMLVSYRAPTGPTKVLQPSLARGRVMRANPAWQTAGFSVDGFPGFSNYVASVSTTSFGTADYYSRTKRVPFPSAASAGSMAGTRVNVDLASTGDGSGGGGFFFSTGFAFGEAADVAGRQSFVGLRPAGAAVATVEPSTLTNCIGVGENAASTTLQIFYGGSAAQTPIDLGANFPAKTRRTDVYHLTLFSPSNATGTVHYCVERMNTGHVATGTLTGAATILPQSTTGVTFNIWGGNNATALSVQMNVTHIYLETDY